MLTTGRKLQATSGETGDVSDTLLLQEESSKQHQERQETSVTPCYYRKKAPSNIRREGDVSDTMLLQEQSSQQHQERQETSVTPC
ncbi:hypothetical protein ACOMHN_048803 [Nucella lapillus]